MERVAEPPLILTGTVILALMAPARSFTMAVASFNISLALPGCLLAAPGGASGQALRVPGSVSPPLLAIGIDGHPFAQPAAGEILEPSAP